EETDEHFNAAKHSQIGHLLDQREQLLRQAAPLENLSAQYDRLIIDRSISDRRLAELELALTAQQAEHRTLEAAALVNESWLRRSALESQIGSMETTAAWPQGAEARMQRLTQAIGKRRKAVRQLRRQRQKCREEHSQISTNEAVWRQSARISALAEHEPW